MCQYLLLSGREAEKPPISKQVTILDIFPNKLKQTGKIFQMIGMAVDWRIRRIQMFIENKSKQQQHTTPSVSHIGWVSIFSINMKSLRD